MASNDRFDAAVIGGGLNGLVAAIALARGGRRTVLLEAHERLGGTARDVEIAPGFRAAPFGVDSGWLPPRVAAAIGLTGLELEAADPALVGPVEPGRWIAIRPDPGQTASGLGSLSAKDAAAWAGFCARIERICGVLERLYLLPPPDIGTTSVAEAWKLLQVGRKLRGLGPTEMMEVLRTVPMAVAELLDEWFEHPALKGLLASVAVRDLCQGPISGATAFTFLHHHVGAPAGGIGWRARPKGGAGALVDRLAERAKAAGVTIRTGARVAAVEVDRDDRACGVRLASGESIAARAVLSTADPRRTLLELVDPVHLDPELMLAVRNVRFRGAQAKVLLGLDRLPDAPGLPADGWRGELSLAPSMTFLERAYDATKYGEWSRAPHVRIEVQTRTRPELAAAGQVMVLHLQYAPYRLKHGSWDAAREELGRVAVETAETYLPGLSARIRHRTVLAPPDLEAEFGLTEGAATQGELMLDQILFMRPIAGSSRYAMPIPGLYLGGAGAHPGPGIPGAPGWLAAAAVVG